MKRVKKRITEKERISDEIMLSSVDFKRKMMQEKANAIDFDTRYDDPKYSDKGDLDTKKKNTKPKGKLSELKSFFSR